MTKDSNSKSPNYIDPEVPGAVGSRNSIFRDGRNEYAESKLLIDEEVDKILSHVSAKLPPEVLNKLHVGGTVKEILHTYFNQGFHNMFNRYLVTVEDELSQKFRDMVDEQENKGLNHYTPQTVSELIKKLGSEKQFNTLTVEKSMVSVYGHLHGHLQKGIDDLQVKTDKLLQEKSDIGSLVGGHHAYSMVKCQFNDNPIKPETVSNISVVINIPEPDLLTPVFHFQTATEDLIKNVISNHIMTLVDDEVEALNHKLAEGGQQPLSESDKIIDKFKRLEKHLGTEDDSDSPQYNYISKQFIEAMKGIGPDIDIQEYDPLSVRENVKKIIDGENIRNKGFNRAVNAITSILDSSKLGYQHFESLKNTRKVFIREYADTQTVELPDERYSITMVYQDDQQLREQRLAYCQQLEEFENEAKKIWEVFEGVSDEFEKEQGLPDYWTVASNILGEDAGQVSKRSVFSHNANGESSSADSPAKVWDEVSFVRPKKSEREKLNDTFTDKYQFLIRTFKLLRNQINDLYKYENTPERVIMDQRLDFLQEKFETFYRQYNPFHIQPGLILEIDVTTIKRQESTLASMSNLISDFLDRVSRGFVDQNIEAHKRMKLVEQQKQQVDFVSV